MANYDIDRCRTRKLTEEQAARVIRECQGPPDFDRFAAEFGVSKACISNIHYGNSWGGLRRKIKREDAA